MHPIAQIPVQSNGLPEGSSGRRGKKGQGVATSVLLDASPLLEGVTIVSARLALGGVGTVPWRARDAEEILNGALANNQTFRTAAEAAVHDPFTVPGTAFKVELAKRTVVRILQTLSGVQS